MDHFLRIRVLASLVSGLAACGIAHAVEGGSSNYLLGMKGPLAAFVPKPGVYLTNNVYYYDASRDNLTPLGNRLVGDISAKALMNIAQLSWVTEQTVGGGRVAFSGLLPYGNIDVGGSVSRGGFSVHDSDSVTAFGDPVLGGSVGWKDRNDDEFRAWSIYGSIFFPVGDYELGRLANPGKNRWAYDVGGAFTMANFTGGREFSAVLGFTFNGENPDTNYNSGNEVHFEFAAKQHLPSHFSMGLVGYWNQQLTADSGGPAVLGDFKGRVFGIGPALSYTFAGSKEHPLTLDVRWYHEFGAKNRVEGDAVFFTLSVPLSITSKPPAAVNWSAAESASQERKAP